MHFDLEMVLVIGSLMTGLIWLLDVIYLRGRRESTIAAEGGDIKTELDEELEPPWYIDYARSFFPVLIIVLLLRSFIAEPFRIPSGSMMPTLLVGDFILVNKFSYGIRLPVLHSKIMAMGEPERGDVVVFRYPQDERLDYIKRVVGVPGDRIGYFEKVIYVNGVPIKQEVLGKYLSNTPAGSEVSMLINESLGEVAHDILVNPNRPKMNREYIVPDGHYFVMGDNRDNSNDSRFWGFVPEENLVGRAMLIWMNWDFSQGSVAFDRIGQKIQ